MNVALVDGDIVLRKAAHGTEYTTYHHPSFGVFRRRVDLSRFLEFNFDDDDPEIMEPAAPETVTEPIEHTYSLIDGILYGIRNNTQCSSMEVYVSISGKKFRDFIEYPVLYKGGRGEKPSNFEKAKNYLLSKVWGNDTHVYTVEDVEVDDALGIVQCEANDNNTIIATIDKDLLQIPGWHYHLDSHEIIFISERQAIKSFWKQMLMGDKVDNIIGIRGIGPQLSEKFLAPCNTELEMEEVVKGHYKEHFGETWEKMFAANKQLLWIMRTLEPERKANAIKKA